MSFGYRTLTRALESFWKDHGGNDKSDLWVNKYLPRYGELVTEKRRELSEEHSNGGRFGLSKIGGCIRAAALKWLGEKGEDFTGSTLATFFIGHSTEAMALATIEAAGFPVYDTQRTITIDPFAQSALDAMTEIEGEAGPLSIKSTGYKMGGWDWRKKKWVRRGFGALVFEGTRNESPGYWAQSQAEMYATKSNTAYILFVAKDMIAAFKDDPTMTGPNGNGSLTFYTEKFYYDKRWTEDVMLPTWNRAWDTVQRGDLPDGAFLLKTGEYARLSPLRTEENKRAVGFDVCSYCAFADACKKASRSKEVA